jgi:hypothetical protein
MVDENAVVEKGIAQLHCLEARRGWGTTATCHDGANHLVPRVFRDPEAQILAVLLFFVRFFLSLVGRAASDLGFCMESGLTLENRPEGIRIRIESSRTNRILSEHHSNIMMPNSNRCYGGCKTAPK